MAGIWLPDLAEPVVALLLQVQHFWRQPPNSGDSSSTRFKSQAESPMVRVGPVGASGVIQLKSKRGASPSSVYGPNRAKEPVRDDERGG